MNRLLGWMRIAVIDLRGILTDARSRGLAMLGPVEIPPLPPVVPANPRRR